MSNSTWDTGRATVVDPMQSGHADDSRGQVAKWVLAIASFCLVMLSSARGGPTINPDSVDYIACANSIAAGTGFLDYDGEPFTRWAPLYPAVLGLGKLVLQWEVVPFARFLNAVLLGACVYLGITWLQVKTHGWILKLGALAIFLSYPLVVVAGEILSEPLFVVLCVAFLMQLERFVRRATLGVFCALALLAAAACLTRYIGVALIMTACVALAFYSDLRLRLRAFAIVAFPALSGFPLALWLLRNRMLAGDPTGLRVSSQLSFSDLIYYTVHTLDHWLLPNAVINRLPVWDIVFPIGVVAIVLWTAFVAPQVVRAVWDRNRVNIVYVVTYLAVLLALSLMTHFSPPNDRLLSPLYIPLTVLAFSFFDCMFDSPLFRLRRFEGALCVVLCILLVYPAAVISNLTRHQLSGQSLGLSSVDWQTDELVARLRSMPPQEVEQLYTNRARFVFHFTGLQAKLLYKNEAGPWEPSDVPKAQAECKGKSLLWLFWIRIDRERLEPWKKALRLQPILETQKGGLYRIPEDLTTQDE